MIKAGVIDGYGCSYIVQNAASVASLMLTTNCMVAEKPKKDGAAPAPDMGGGMPGGMGGMGF